MHFLGRYINSICIVPHTTFHFSWNVWCARSNRLSHWNMVINYSILSLYKIMMLTMKMWNSNLLFNLISSLQFEIQFLWFIGQVFLSICIKYGWFRHYFAWGLSSGSFASIFLRRSIQSPDNFLNLWCAKLIWHSLFYLRTFL